MKRWSTEEMIDKPNSLSEEDTEEMMKWRGINQEEMDQCCEKLAEKMGEEVLDKYKVENSKREAYRGRGPRWNGGVYEEAGVTGYESGEKIVWQESSPCSRNFAFSV